MVAESEIFSLFVFHFPLFFVILQLILQRNPVHNMTTRKIKRAYQQPRTEVVEMQATCPLLTGSVSTSATMNTMWEEENI